MVFCTEFVDGCDLESRCLGRVYGADGAVHKRGAENHMLQLNI